MLSLLASVGLAIVTFSYGVSTSMSHTQAMQAHQSLLQRSNTYGWKSKNHKSLTKMDLACISTKEYRFSATLTKKTTRERFLLLALYQKTQSMRVICVCLWATPLTTREDKKGADLQLLLSYTSHTQERKKNLQIWGLQVATKKREIYVDHPMKFFCRLNENLQADLREGWLHFFASPIGYRVAQLTCFTCLLKHCTHPLFDENLH